MKTGKKIKFQLNRIQEVTYDTYILLEHDKAFAKRYSSTDFSAIHTVYRYTYEGFDSEIYVVYSLGEPYSLRELKEFFEWVINDYNELQDWKRLNEKFIELLNKEGEEEDIDF